MPKRKADLSHFMPPPSDVEVEPEMHVNICAHPGCTNKGEHKAPKSRDNLREYQWLCSEHIKEFNKQWNYFDGMEEEEIINFQKDAALGHRPTWKLGGNRSEAEARLHEAVNRFSSWDKKLHRKVSNAFTRDIPRQQHDALAVFDLEHPTTHADIKKSYKALVKTHHPDVNGSSPESEEMFKHITAAYQLLVDAYQEG